MKTCIKYTLTFVTHFFTFIFIDFKKDHGVIIVICLLLWYLAVQGDEDNGVGGIDVEWLTVCLYINKNH
jgi:hypothetical protein